MLKLFQFWTRRADQAHAEAIARCGEHAERLAADAPSQVSRLSVNVGLPTDYSGWIPEEAPAFDAIAEWWVDVDDCDALRRLTVEAGLLRNEEERRFIGTAQLMAAKQIVHLDRRRQHRGVKTMFLLTRRPEMTREQAMAYWHEQHAPLVRDTLGDALVRYATNVGVDADLTGWPEEAPPFDGIAELWLDLPMADMHATVKAAADLLLPDERSFLGTYRWLAVDELVNRGTADAQLPADALSLR